MMTYSHPAQNVVETTRGLMDQLALPVALDATPSRRFSDPVLCSCPPDGM